MAHMAQQEGEDVARRAFKLKAFVEHLQDCVSSLERCSKPVIAAVRGGCVGAGVDLICACDIRLYTHDAWFTVKRLTWGLRPTWGRFNDCHVYARFVSLPTLPAGLTHERLMSAGWSAR
mmetsp:Transcript_9733/g.28075  ORF Transcript_9733/g.28075 Transcript_9733/m.28075 type:complete len:119 (+) Transcript_9733:703-1059(+)